MLRNLQLEWLTETMEMDLDESIHKTAQDTIYEKCDGLKFEPAFITRDASIPFEKLLEFKFKKLKQMLSSFRNKQQLQ